MSSVAVSNVIPFQRPVTAPPVSDREVRERRRGEQRSLMDAVYATGSMIVAAGDRTNRLAAARLQVYGFVTIEEVGEDGSMRRLRPSEAIRARAERPWRLARPACGTAVTIPIRDGFLFEGHDFRGDKFAGHDVAGMNG